MGNDRHRTGDRGLRMAGGQQARNLAMALAVALHGAIIAGLGLASFGIVMIGLVTIAAAAPYPQDVGRPTH